MLELETRLATLAMVHSPLWIFHTRSKRIVWANAKAISYWGAKSGFELYQRDMGKDMSLSAEKRLQHILHECYENQKTVREIWTLYPNEMAPKTGELTITAFPYGEDHHTLLCQISAELTATNTELLHTTTALNHTATMISLYDRYHNLMYCNPAARDAYPDQAQNLRDMLDNEDTLFSVTEALKNDELYKTEIEIETNLGTRWHALVFKRTLSAVNAEPVTLVSATDITQQRNAQQLAYQLAYNDALTGLPNRSALMIHLDDLLEKNRDIGTSFALYFLDLDRFKMVNDSLGHAIGDELLKEVANRLIRAIGDTGFVSRLAGDEFVVIINGVTAHDELKQNARQILHAMQEPAVIQDHHLRIVPSIGICRFPEDGNTVEELLDKADSAMYLAKADQSSFCLFNQETNNTISQAVKNRLSIENDLVNAVKQDQLELYYQPKIDSQSLTVSGVEALLRWHHPVKGLLSPDKFIEIAEETGQILDIGEWVMHAGMEQQKRWMDAGINVTVAINVSVKQFQSSHFLGVAAEAIEQTGCEPGHIELEITESMLMGDTESIHYTLQRLSAMGFRLALDDFGTGYSNLAYLQKYPLDTLKIDRLFLANEKHSMLMSTMLKMGSVLGLNVVAEGVETAKQAQWLAARGCDQLQGYYFSKPLTVNKATQFLRENMVGGSSGLNRAA